MAGRGKHEWRQNEARWRVVKAFPLALRDSERRRGGQRRIAKESDREVRICQDDPGLPGRYPTSTSENRFQLCRFNSKIHGAGEKVAGLFHIGSWKIAVAGQNANLKAARRDENAIGELLGCRLLGTYRQVPTRRLCEWVHSNDLYLIGPSASPR